MTTLIACLLFGSSPLIPIKVNVDGEGFLRFIRDGRLVFTKKATLVAIDGCLGADGAKLLPNINVPEGVDSLKIDLMGNVTAGGAHLGRLVVAVFPKGANCAPVASFLAFEDRPTLENPGEDSAGVIRTAGTPEKSVIAAQEDPKPTVITTLHTTPAAVKTGTATTPQKSNGSLGQVTIAVHEHSEVVGGSFTLGDIASISGPDDLVDTYKKVRIGETAVAGVTRYVDQKFISLKLQGAGHPIGTYAIASPEKAEVVRKTKTVTADDLIAFAVAAAQAKIGSKVAMVTTKNVDPIIADDGEITLDATDPEQTQRGIKVVVTAREGNRIVGARTVELTSSGKVAAVKVGDIVTVVLKCGTATIEVTGKALSAGFVGERIQVSVLASAGQSAGQATTQTGVVDENGKVEVEL